LRETIKDLVPEKIRNRGDKQGYSSPMPSWLQNEISDFFRENIRDAAKLPFARRDIVIKESNEFLSGKRPFDPIWWNLIATSKWINMFKMSV
jgi:hypothetical protein